MFVNLSNHDSSKWSEKQLNEAQKNGIIIDVQFPNINPTASEKEISNLADDYLNQIISIINNENSTKEETTIHIMGEMTFVYAFVTKAKQLGINNCVASTTQRIVEELPDGKKNVTFDFVQFRKY